MSFSSMTRTRKQSEVQEINIQFDIAVPLPKTSKPHHQAQDRLWAGPSPCRPMPAFAQAVFGAELRAGYPTKEVSSERSHSGQKRTVTTRP